MTAPAVPETLDEPCPICALSIGDHTLRQMRVCKADADESMNLDYEDAPAGAVAPLAIPVAASVIVRAAVYRVDEIYVPALAFSFFAPSGGAVVAEASLVVDEPILRNFQKLIDKAITGAVRGARERRDERDGG